MEEEERDTYVFHHFGQQVWHHPGAGGGQELAVQGGHSALFTRYDHFTKSEDPAGSSQVLDPMNPRRVLDYIRHHSAYFKLAKTHPRWKEVVGSTGAEEILAKKARQEGEMKVEIHLPAEDSPNGMNTAGSSAQISGGDRSERERVVVREEEFFPLSAVDLANAPEPPHGGGGVLQMGSQLASSVWRWSTAALGSVVRSTGWVGEGSRSGGESTPHANAERSLISTAGSNTNTSGGAAGTRRPAVFDDAARLANVV